MPLGVRSEVVAAGRMEAEALHAVGEDQFQLAAMEQEVVAGGAQGDQVAQVLLASGGAVVLRNSGRPPFARGQIVHDPHPPAI